MLNVVHMLCIPARHISAFSSRLGRKTKTPIDYFDFNRHCESIRKGFAVIYNPLMMRPIWLSMSWISPENNLFKADFSLFPIITYFKTNNFTYS